MLDPQVVSECRGEVADVHRFFSAWFQGDVPRTEDAWAAIANRLAPGFVLITPGGKVVSRRELVEQLRPRYGRYRESGYPIEVRRFEVRHIGDHHVVATYEEWQGRGEDRTGRLSTAVFERDPSQPNHVRWTHVHETWLPGHAPAA
jgi:hypothetical protein